MKPEIMTFPKKHPSETILLFLYFVFGFLLDVSSFLDSILHTLCPTNEMLFALGHRMSKKYLVEHFLRILSDFGMILGGVLIYFTSILGRFFGMTYTHIYIYIFLSKKRTGKKTPSILVSVLFHPRPQGPQPPCLKLSWASAGCAKRKQCAGSP